MMHERILCLDYGTKRVGVAISDPLNITAQPLTVLTCTNAEPPTDAVADLINKWNVKKIIIGLPLNLAGQEGKAAQAARIMARKIALVVPVEIEFWDERFSSLSINKLMIQNGVRRKKRKLCVDKLAATIILQNYLDFQKNNSKQ